MKHIIDTSKPWIPDDFDLEENKSLGEITWDPDKVKLWLSEEQKSWCIKGKNLKDKVPNPLNSSVLRYLLDNPSLIPDNWKVKSIYFWGTIFRDSDGDRCVLYLLQCNGQWGWSVSWLNYDWYTKDPSAVLASTSDTLSLDSAIKKVKEAGYLVYKEI